MEEIIIQIDPVCCIGCGICGEVCPFGLPVRGDMGRFIISDPKQCVGCSACERNCPVGAINLDEQKGCGCIWCNDVNEEGNPKCSSD